ncbi:large subunit ribosomal protein L37Ae [Nematocida homosporus]|uniref:large subunit ribosomal protein L37Ae n=1 Tax=Nematocida homosporus TaxID=1912981 RepID=UPI00221F7220|nr:large subunit ribosomal protein L37Ae [Nematocida homosporus]KAI5185937.1 large subunit ribosomal protein L37Ae [Nematocida homosporus]
MTQKTKKVGVVGKYGPRYGVSLRKRIKKVEETQHSKYICTFCGKRGVKREVVGVWKCKACKVTVAGGAYSVTTVAGESAKSQNLRLKEFAQI